MSETNAELLFFDPFAEEANEAFNPLQSYDYIFERYRSGEVTHDYTADNFVADAQALMLDATFLERFAEAQLIATHLHELCGHDQAVQNSVQRLFEQHDHAAHDEAVHAQEKTNKDKKAGKKEKKKQPYYLWRR